MKVIRFKKRSGIYNAGEIAGFKDSEADGYIADGIGELHKNPDGPVTDDPPPGGGGGDQVGYGSRSKADLVALAEARELTVTRGDGQDGDPVKADYVAALEAADAAPVDDQGEGRPSDPVTSDSEPSGQPGDEEEE